jgi:hypothetical protein
MSAWEKAMEEKVAVLKLRMKEHLEWHKEPCAQDMEYDGLNEQLEKLSSEKNHETDLLRIKQLENGIKEIEDARAEQVINEAENYVPEPLSKRFPIAFSMTKEEHEKEMNRLIVKVLKMFDFFEEEMNFQLKEGTFNKEIKENTEEAKYWKGFRYGLQMFWTDFVLPEKEKWEEYNNE